MCLQISKWQWLCLTARSRNCLLCKSYSALFYFPLLKLRVAVIVWIDSGCHQRLLSALCTSKQKTEKSMNILFIAGVYCRVEWKCPQFETQTNQLKMFTPKHYSSLWAKELYSILERADMLYIYRIYVVIIWVILLSALLVKFWIKIHLKYLVKTKMKYAYVTKLKYGLESYITSLVALVLGYWGWQIQKYSGGKQIVWAVWFTLIILYCTCHDHLRMHQWFMTQQNLEMLCTVYRWSKLEWLLNFDGFKFANSDLKAWKRRQILVISPVSYCIVMFL